MGIDVLTNATQAASDLAQQEAEDAAKQAAREHQVGMQIINVATQDSQAFLKGGFQYYAGVQLYNAQ